MCVGAVAAVELTASNLPFDWFSMDWYSSVRHFLVDNVGASVNFVAGYISFAITGTLAVSAYGWWLVGLHRQASIEFLEGWDKGLQHIAAQHNEAAWSATWIALAI